MLFFFRLLSCVSFFLFSFLFGTFLACKEFDVFFNLRSLKVEFENQVKKTEKNRKEKKKERRKEKRKEKDKEKGKGSVAFARG